MSFLLKEALSVVRKDKLVIVPSVFFFVAMGFLEAKGFRFASQVTTLTPSRAQIFYFLATTVCSELIIKNVTIAWAGQVIHSGRVVVGIRSFGNVLRIGMHLVLALGVLVIPAIVAGAGVAKLGVHIGNPVLAVLVAFSLVLWFFTQFSSQFIIFESEPFWKGLMQSIRFVRFNPWVSMAVFSLGLVLVLCAAMVGAMISNIPIVGNVGFAIVEGVGTSLMVTVQTVAFAIVRAKYSTTV
jgi:hypothetical protein